MRPVEKAIVGDTLTLSDGSAHSITQDYNPYGAAKSALVANLGLCCSYCEEAYHQERDIHVEHVQPKGLQQYANLETRWNNFLLSCATCNGTDNKGTKDVVLGEIHLPHLNNTFLSLKYDAGGVVMVNPALKGDSYTHANNLLHLVGLNKNPKTSNPGDTRWHKRSDDWNLAHRYLTRFTRGEVDVDVIIELIKNRGGWSIWYTVFYGIDEVRDAMLNFQGTARHCFDPANHFEPINRNPGDIDPV